MRNKLESGQCRGISGGSPDLSGSSELSGSYRISDILPHNPNDLNPVTSNDITVIMRWAEHPDVKGHIYQLESGHSEIHHERDAYLEYYRGVKDDEGYITDPKNVVFLKAVHETDIIAVTSLRWRADRFFLAGRTAYWERLIVDPELPPRKKIGLALGIQVGLTAFYKCNAYTDGLPAKEIRATTYADDEAQGFERNERLLLALGFEHHGEPFWLNDRSSTEEQAETNRRIQPWRANQASFEAALPGALERVRRDQPEYADYLKQEWIKLKANSQ